MKNDEMSLAEWQVMRVVWANPGTTSRFIIDSLSESFNWQAATVKTLLGRLKDKGLLDMTKEDGRYRYLAKVSEQDQLILTLTRLQSLICNTKQVDLVTLLLERGEFSQQDLEGISKLAQQLSQAAPEKLTCNCLTGQCTCGQAERRHT